MNSEALLQELNSIFTDILDNKSISLNLSTTALDIEEWDSISHIQLIVAIEKKFKIKFTASEIQSFKNVGDMIQAIQSKGI
jgi:acyl carrier protein